AAAFRPLSTAGWMEIAIWNPPVYDLLERVGLGAVVALPPGISGSASSIEKARLRAQASIRANRGAALRASFVALRCRSRANCSSRSECLGGAAFATAPARLVS